MAEQFVVDAHALIWFLEANPKLGPQHGRRWLTLRHEFFFPQLRSQKRVGWSIMVEPEFQAPPTSFG